jgi:hypothetical protein
MFRFNQDLCCGKPQHLHNARVSILEFRRAYSTRPNRVLSEVLRILRTNLQRIRIPTQQRQVRYRLDSFEKDTHFYCFQISVVKRKMATIPQYRQRCHNSPATLPNLGNGQRLQEVITEELRLSRGVFSSPISGQTGEAICLSAYSRFVEFEFAEREPQRAV